jgi:hypothetical protein
MFDQVKRELSQQEIDEKTKECLELLRLNDSAEGEIVNLKSAAKRLTEKIKLRVLEGRLLRIDIERGYVWEDAPEPQQQLPLDDLVSGIADRVADELRAREAAAEPVRLHPEHYDRFIAEYPAATSLKELGDALSDLLTTDQHARFFTEEDEPIVTWHPQSGIFSAVDWWSRIELAKKDGEARASAGLPEMPGLTIPARVPMPEALAEIAGDTKAKKKRQRRSAPPVTTETAPAEEAVQ